MRRQFSGPLLASVLTHLCAGIAASMLTFEASTPVTPDQSDHGLKVTLVSTPPTPDTLSDGGPREPTTPPIQQEHTQENVHKPEPEPTKPSLEDELLMAKARERELQRQLEIEQARATATAEHERRLADETARAKAEAERNRQALVAERAREERLARERREREADRQRRSSTNSNQTETVRIRNEEDKPRATVKKGPTSGPVVTRRSQPTYPRALKRKKIGGTATVRMQVDARGKVSAAQIVSSSGYSELDKAALKAARRWRFKPALKNGVKVSSTTQVNIVFQP